MEKILSKDMETPIRLKYTPCAACDLRPGIVLPHFHDAIEIIFTLSGTATAICNGVKYPQTPGSIFFAASNEIHYFTDRSEDTDGLVIDIEPHLLSGSAARLRESIPVSRIWEDSSKQHQLWELVHFMHRNMKDHNRNSYAFTGLRGTGKRHSSQCHHYANSELLSGALYGTPVFGTTFSGIRAQCQSYQPNLLQKTEDQFL